MSDTDQNTESLPDKTPKPVPQKNSKTKSAQQPADAAVKKSTAQPGKPSSRQPASMTGFALLLSLCALGLSGYVGWRGYTLEQTLPELRTGLDQLQPQIARQQARLATLEQDSSASLAQYQQHLQSQLQISQQRETQLQSRVDTLSAKVRTLEGATRNQWRLAEVEYLLNLANQQLLTVHDVATSHALLTSADQILAQLDDYALFPVRQALAEDLAALQTAPQVNRQDIWLQLQAIGSLVPNLTMLDNRQRLTDQVLSESTATDSNTDDAPGRSWQTVANDVLMDAWQRFSSLFRITTERTEPVEIRLTDEQEQLIRQKMQLLIEQSQLALITGQQSVYQLSLQQASQWLTRYFTIDGGASQQLADELATLAGLTIEPNIPGIQRSLAALKALNTAEPSDSKQVTPTEPSEGQTTTEPDNTGEPAK